MVSYRDRDIAAVLHPQTNALRHEEVGPHIIQRGDGVFVYDDSGKEFLDSGAGLWCTNLGYKSGRVAKVAHDTLNSLAYFPLFRHSSTEPAIDLSSKLLDIAPVPMSKVMLQCSGSEANDTAVKIAWYYWHAQGKPQKRKIISRLGSYHGSTCVAISMTGNPAYHRSFGLPFEGFLHADAPNYFRGAMEGESEEAFSQRLAESLEAMILREGPDTIAAFWADPIQGNAGAVPPPAGYFDRVQEILRRHDVLFVSDEVICGFGRTGSMWGSQSYGLKPDMLTCAKGLSAAMAPISAVLLSEKIYQVLREESNKNGAFVHGYTYGGHPLGCSIALEVLKIYEEMNILGHVQEIEPVFLDELNKLKDHPLVGNVSGIGLIGGVDIVSEAGSRKAFPVEKKVEARIDAHARRHGLILRVVPGRLAFSPPLVITEEETIEMMRRTRRALDDTLAELQ